MDRTTAILFLLLVGGACQSPERSKVKKDRDPGGYKLTFGSTFRGLEYNLSNDTLKGGYDHKVFFSDTIFLNSIEKSIILSSFFDAGIHNYRGKVYVMGSKWQLPSFSDEIFVYKDDSLMATIEIINRHYESVSFLPVRKEKRIVRFRDTVWSILSSKEKYHALSDSLTIMMSPNPKKKGFPLPSGYYKVGLP